MGIRTFLIADVRGYTQFTQERGDEAAARLAAKFAEIARAGVEASGGDLVELRGDEALAAFASARGALRAAAELQLVFGDETARDPSYPLPVGIGLDAGEAVPIAGGWRGGALNLAARLCSKAGPGEILASRGVIHLARAVDGLRFTDLEPLLLKGLEEPVPVVAVTAASTGGDVVGPSQMVEAGGRTELPPELDLVTPLIGREAEVGWLYWSWRVSRAGSGRSRFVSGPPGIGRTRLAAEVARRVHDDGGHVRNVAPGRGSTTLASTLTELTDGPALVVLDDLDAFDASGLRAAAELADSLRSRPILLLGTFARLTQPVASVLRRHDTSGENHRVLEPLDESELVAVARIYGADAAEQLPVDMVMAKTGGVPGRVHPVVSEWAHVRASGLLSESASRAEVDRRGLRAAEAALAVNVVDLQLARDRARVIATEASGAVMLDAGDSRDPVLCPFKGLASFDVADADYFFGREQLVAELIARLVGATVLGVVGPSGSGKSSVVRAGLVPALASGVLPGSESWRIVVTRPGEDPLSELSRALGTPDAGDRAIDDSLTSLRDDARLVVVVDQFEEVFTSCHDEAERDRYVEALVRAARFAGGRALLVLAIRADFYGECARYPALATLLGTNHVLVGPMTSDELGRAIEFPARRVGLRVEEQLTAALVADVLGQPGGLPLLSSTLLELWARRKGRTLRLESLQRIGGVSGAVARLAETAYARLTPEQRQVARSILLRLAGPGDGDAIVRRRASLSEFDAQSDTDVAQVLSVLTDSRLLTVNEGSVEVAHEALLREWPRLRTWLEEDLEGRRLRQHLTAAAREWHGSGEDPAELYRGARLAAALDWMGQHEIELNELERRFLTESLAVSEREQIRQRRTNQRLRILLAGAAVFLGLALVAGGLALLQRREAETQRADAEAAALEARDAAEAAERSAVVADAQRLGAQAVLEDDLDLSLLLAREAFALDDSSETRSTLLATLLKAPAALSVIEGNGERVEWIEASPDGTIIAVGFSSPGQGGNVTFLDSSSFRQISRTYFTWPTFVHAFVGGGPSFVIDQPGEIQILSGEGWADKQIEPVAEGTFLGGFAAPADGSTLFSLEGNDADGEFRSYVLRRDPVTGDAGVAVEIPEIRGDWGSAGILAKGGFVYLVGRRGARPETFVLDADSLKVVDRYELGPAVAVAPDGGTLVAGGVDGTITFVDLATKATKAVAGVHSGTVSGVSFSSDGRRLATSSDDHPVVIWDAAERRVHEVIAGPTARVTGPVFDGTARTAFTADVAGNVVAWDVSGDRRIGAAFRWGADAEGWDVGRDVSPDGTTLARGTDNGTIVFFDIETGVRVRETRPLWTDTEIAEFRRREPQGDIGRRVIWLDYSPDGTQIAVGGTNRRPLVLDVATDTVRRLPDRRAGWIGSISFSRDGTKILIGGNESAQLRDARSGDLIREFLPDDDPTVLSPAFLFLEAGLSPDGRRVVATVADTQLSTSTSAGVTVRVFNVENGQEEYSLIPDIEFAKGVWSPDGGHLATAGADSGQVALWDAATGLAIGRPATVSTAPVRSLEFTDDGQVLVASAYDGVVRMFEVPGLEPIATPLPTPADRLAFAHFLPGGDTLLTLSEGGQAFRWQIDPGEWAELACRVANRDLTAEEWQAYLPGRPQVAVCPAAGAPGGG